ncbi:acylphosphatase [Sporolactobacillus inulinus]|uniref:Acylphosphatase n=1 Tax=Sporolactobacillus inulinus CASD TaxID=1069536 RepID=A0A0U1QP14_9BACL|nr:acylphosphatase [Sporolactobacillus inulinus]KLI02544.1 acylphosphatase [Sporolactobacillus inulinus CASD]GEB78168.1 acylphosphatase [Sporolactobacillus inulinus]
MGFENEKVISVRILVTGRVQGVGFRYFIKQTAAQHSVNGWVRNRDDGRVEIAAEGTRQQVDAFIQKVRRGTFFARVKAMDIQMHQPQNYIGFEIKATM